MALMFYPSIFSRYIVNNVLCPMFFSKKRTSLLQWEKSSGKCDYFNKLRTMYSRRYVSKELWQTTRVQFLCRRVLFGKTYARLRHLFSRGAVWNFVVRPSANLSPYITILFYYLYIYISNLLYLTIIVLSLVNRQTSWVWLHSRARVVLTRILYYL